MLKEVLNLLKRYNLGQNLIVFLSSLKMAIATFFSRILGLVREQFIAYLFGASGFTDAFLIAYRIPNLLRDLFAEGAFSSAFVPTFVAANNVSQETARKLLWALFILLGSITLFFTGLIFIFTPELINLFAPTFIEVPEKYEMTVLLTRIMSPFLFFVSIAALFMGVLNSLKIFFVPAFAPAFFNITMILSMLIFPSYLISEGLNPILSLGVGVFIGGLVQAFVQFPLIIKNGYGPVWPGKLFSKETKKVMTLLGPGLIGFAATQINLVVTTIIASSTIVGAVSWLSFAFRLFQLPVGILSVSIGNSNLIHFSRAWKAGKEEEAKGYLEGSYFLSFMLVIPAMVALYVCADEMVNVIFERGMFTSESTVMTAKALKWYALGLPFYSIYKIFVPTFYSIDRQKIPVICSILGIIFNIVFCLLLTPIYGFEILALGTTLSIFLNATIQGIILRSDLSMRVSSFLNVRIFKLILSGGITAWLGLTIKAHVDFLSMDLLFRCAYLGAYLAGIAFIYFTLCVILGERALVKKAFARFTR